MLLACWIGWLVMVSCYYCWMLVFEWFNSVVIIYLFFIFVWLLILGIYCLLLSVLFCCCVLIARFVYLVACVCEFIYFVVGRGGVWFCLGCNCLTYLVGLVFDLRYLVFVFVVWFYLDVCLIDYLWLIALDFNGSLLV